MASPFLTTVPLEKFRELVMIVFKFSIDYGFDDVKIAIFFLDSI